MDDHLKAYVVTIVLFLIGLLLSVSVIEPNIHGNEIDNINSLDNRVGEIYQIIETNIDKIASEFGMLHFKMMLQLNLIDIPVQLSTEFINQPDIQKFDFEFMREGRSQLLVNFTKTDVNNKMWNGTINVSDNSSQSCQIKKNWESKVIEHDCIAELVEILNATYTSIVYNSPSYKIA